MIKLNKTTGELLRENIPQFLRGLDASALSDLRWTDPALGVSDFVWLPETHDPDQIQPRENQRFCGEQFRLSGDNKSVIVTLDIVDLTADEIAAVAAANTKLHSTISPIQFKLRFPANKRIAISAARKTNPVIEDLWSLLDEPRYTAVDLTSETIIQGVRYLQSVDLITADEATAILAQ